MQQHKQVLINYRLQRAKETAEEAEIALNYNKLRLAENRIYYAIFYSVHALALLNNFSTSSHSTLKGWFNKEFVFPGKVESRLYKIYNRAFDKRQAGDYDDFVTFEKDEVIADINGMQEFLSKIENFIKESIVDEVE